jgi:hypothetical protein
MHPSRPRAPGSRLGEWIRRPLLGRPSRRRTRRRSRGCMTILGRSTTAFGDRRWIRPAASHYQGLGRHAEPREHRHRLSAGPLRTISRRDPQRARLLDHRGRHEDAPDALLPTHGRYRVRLLSALPSRHLRGPDLRTAPRLELVHGPQRLRGGQVKGDPRIPRRRPDSASTRSAHTRPILFPHVFMPHLISVLAGGILFVVGLSGGLGPI